MAYEVTVNVRNKKRRSEPVQGALVEVKGISYRNKDEYFETYTDENGVAVVSLEQKPSYYCKYLVTVSKDKYVPEKEYIKSLVDKWIYLEPLEIAITVKSVRERTPISNAYVYIYLQKDPSAETYEGYTDVNGHATFMVNQKSYYVVEVHASGFKPYRISVLPPEELEIVMYPTEAKYFLQFNCRSTHRSGYYYVGYEAEAYGSLFYNGTPIAGATVNLYVQGILVGSGVTGDDGRYSIVWIPSEAGVDVEVRAEAVVDGEVVGSSRRFITVKVEQYYLSLTVYDTTRVEGKVVRLVINGEVVGETVTDGDGRYRFIWIPAEAGTYKVYAEAEVG